MRFVLLRWIKRAGNSPVWPALLLLCAMTANRQERILSFHSDIRIAADATMEVTETIRVRAEGQSIRRGIYREIPTRYRDRLGNAFNVDLDVINVTRNALPEPWSMHRRA